jgi:hypothetical protein
MSAAVDIVLYINIGCGLSAFVGFTQLFCAQRLIKASTGYCLTFNDFHIACLVDRIYREVSYCCSDNQFLRGANFHRVM